MSYNANIILGGQAPDVLNALASSNAMAQQRIEFDRTNAMNRMLQEQGAGIIAGDQNALNALAGYDPQAALAVQSSRLGMDATRLDMDYRRQQMSALDAETKRAAEEYARGLSKEQAAAEAAELEAGVKQALAAPNAAAFDAMVTQMGRPELVGQFENRQMLAAQFLSVAEILKMTAPPEPAKPQTTEAKLAADFKAGLIDQATYEAGLARLAPKGTSLTVDPTTGVVTFSEGAGVGAGGPAVNSGDALRTQITDAQTMLQMIGRIATNPALPKVTGPLEGGGGNNVDDFSMSRRAYYGGDGLGVIQEIAQLQGNAWLGARALLKGGGQITDYESKKAESAMARLSRAQGDDEFLAALKDLEDALREGIAKLQGGAAPAAEAAPAATGNTTSSGIQWSIVE